MARLQLSKASLHREQGLLETYQRFLPSLDLKRRQLLAERSKAAKQLAATQGRIAGAAQAVGETLPMLADRNVDLADLVQIAELNIGIENLMGIHLPTLETVRLQVRNYAFMGKPHWVDNLAEALRETVELRLRAQVEARRLALLELAVTKTTQRVNLFDKVLIPRAQRNIKRIRIHLSDAQTAAVVRSKIAKRKHAALRVA